MIAEWMTLGKKIVEFKDPGNGVDNYRPIPCLPFMCNLSTGWVVSESTYNFLIKNNFSARRAKEMPKRQLGSLRAGFPLWARKASLARTRVLARLASLA